MTLKPCYGITWIEVHPKHCAFRGIIVLKPSTEANHKVQCAVVSYNCNVFLSLPYKNNRKQALNLVFHVWNIFFGRCCISYAYSNSNQSVPCTCVPITHLIINVARWSWHKARSHSAYKHLTTMREDFFEGRWVDESRTTTTTAVLGYMASSLDEDGLNKSTR